MPRKKVTTTDVEEVKVDPSPPIQRSPTDENLLTINDRERGITLADSDEIKWNYIMTAYSRHYMLTGSVVAVETAENGRKIAAVDFQGLRIVIPATEMFDCDFDVNENLPREYDIRLMRMLGATVDFLIMGIDSRNRAAVGSRKQALRSNLSRYYDSGRVKEGILMSCRIVGVAFNTATVEAYGLETTITGHDLSWKWLPDVAEEFSAGDLVVAKVMELARKPDGKYELHLSAREANENPDRKAAEKIVAGSSYLGTVTGVKDGVIFVRLQIGVNAKTKLYRSVDLPQRLDTVSFLVRSVDEQHCRALGLITRIVKKNNKLR